MDQRQDGVDRRRPFDVAVPRDRHGTFEPRLIPKRARRFTGLDEKILALDTRGMTVREIQAFLAEMYAVEWRRT